MMAIYAQPRLYLVMHVNAVTIRTDTDSLSTVTSHTRSRV